MRRSKLGRGLLLPWVATALVAGRSVRSTKARAPQEQPSPASNEFVPSFIRSDDGCIEVRQDQDDEGEVHETTCDEGKSEQLFSLAKFEGDLYQIRAEHSGKCLGVQGGDSSDRAKVVETACTTEGSVTWTILGSGSERQIRASHTNLCLRRKKKRTGFFVFLLNLLRKIFSFSNFHRAVRPGDRYHEGTSRQQHRSRNVRCCRPLLTLILAFSLTFYSTQQTQPRFCPGTT